MCWWRCWENGTLTPCWWECFYIGIATLGGIPGGSVEKNPSASAGDVSPIPGLGRSPGEGNGNSFQISCLGNPMDRGAWWASSMGLQRVGHDLATKQQQQQ